jgi:hypothetical protein
LGASRTRIVFLDQSVLKEVALFFRDVIGDPENPRN